MIVLRIGWVGRFWLQSTCCRRAEAEERWAARWQRRRQASVSSSRHRVHSSVENAHCQQTEYTTWALTSPCLHRRICRGSRTGGQQFRGLLAWRHQWQQVHLIASWIRTNYDSRALYGELRQWGPISFNKHAYICATTQTYICLTSTSRSWEYHMYCRGTYTTHAHQSIIPLRSSHFQAIPQRIIYSTTLTGSGFTNY